MSSSINPDSHTWMKNPKPLFICGSVITGVLAVLAEGTGDFIGSLLLCVCVLTICGWAATGRPSLVQAVAIVSVAVIALGWTVAAPEPTLFQPILLAVAVGWKVTSNRMSVLLGLVLAIVPLVAVLPPDGAGWGWWNWAIGTLFSWTFGRLIHLLEATVNDLTDAREQLVELAAREERRRISRDVHDLVGHSMTAMLLNIRAARQNFKNNPDESHKALADAEQIGVTGMEDIRAAMVGLRNDVVTGKQDKTELMRLPDGESIQSLLERQNHLSIKTSGDMQNLQGPLGVAVYRTLQECITNITKHSKDGTGNVELFVGKNAVNLRADNPIAASHKFVQPSSNTLGLISMQERVKAQGGAFSSEIKNARWYLKCRIPIND